MKQRGGPPSVVAMAVPGVVVRAHEDDAAPRVTAVEESFFVLVPSVEGAREEFAAWAFLAADGGTHGLLQEVRSRGCEGGGLGNEEALTWRYPASPSTLFPTCGGWVEHPSEFPFMS